MNKTITTLLAGGALALALVGAPAPALRNATYSSTGACSGLPDRS